VHGWSPGDLEHLARLLMSLLPGHPNCHNRIRDLNPAGDKKAPIQCRGATGKDYLEHISCQAYDGLGALGIFPGQRGKAIGADKYCWHTSFLALDFDSTRPLDLRTLIDTLASCGIFAYPSVGTTGRGSHLYIFLDDSLSLPEAARIVKLIASLAVQADLPYPECRPSTGYGRGQAIFLPYRGAEQDGLGFNPLLDPDHDLHPMRLGVTEKWLKRTQLDQLREFARVLEQDGSHARVGPSPGTTRRSKPTKPSSNIEAWRTELKRVKPFWRKDRRQNLAMGLAAYGVSGLRLPRDDVRDDLQKLASQLGDDERKRR
jgi:hypothetical protein